MLCNIFCNLNYCLLFCSFSLFCWGCSMDLDEMLEVQTKHEKQVGEAAKVRGDDSFRSFWLVKGIQKEASIRFPVSLLDWTDIIVWKLVHFPAVVLIGGWWILAAVEFQHFNFFWDSLLIYMHVDVNIYHHHHHLNVSSKGSFNY